ncbi:hypothetical protein [Streptomyces xanthophaeus]|uniref:Uncharacterized protein n=1 Tax=Streptomyces xanthophaeus TaxID=67385 RepID=A0A919GSA6_9ACTN|nr:hypothetical protein [Streptomyces xanthophaeus]GHI82855.1 hypothetical protein Sxan_02190 [Streptomyces xanthophaeus]
MTENGTPKLPYTEGSVWSLQFIQVKPGATSKYLDHLRGTWTPLMEEAKRQGVLTGYRILMGPPSGADDWNVLLVVEVPNMSSLDGYGQKIAAIEAGIRNGEHPTGTAELRGVLGAKLVREITLH